MAGAIDHIMLNSNDYPRALKFYSWLMPKIGYPKSVSYDQPGPLTGWFHDDASLWLSPADSSFSSELFDKRKVGIREIAFKADSREQIDQLAREVVANGGTILDPPREYAYTPGYYAVFFTDPDGLKLELVHRPG